MRRGILQALAPVVAGALFLLGLAAVGKLTRDWLHEQHRATLAFGDIDCPPPPGVDRGQFLDEVQSLNELPDQLRLLDDDLAPRLASAFLRHPWVEQVEQVAITPARQVQVRLRYRAPVLAVRLGPQTRAVDGQGILLPPRADTAGLPIYQGRAAPPAGLSGTSWGDKAVEAAARTLGDLRPHQPRLRLTTVEVTAVGLVSLRTAAGTLVIWGHARGAEADGETPATQKIERLLRYCTEHGDLDWPRPPQVHDVRARATP
jgi:hypothetical protein